MSNPNANPNAISWFEIPVTDIARAQVFYETLLAQTLHREVFPMGGQSYTLAIFTAPDEGVKGCLQSGADTPKATTEGTLVYLDCSPSIDAALARAQTLDATLLKAKTALPPGMGFIAHIQDPDGNRVGLHALA
ncbi:MAG: VOC family protein [Rhodoferax sp.]|uniref:VOC family protein n=1 Tax=Rhodoferax sp. TaxID=50421 RepID=UPI003262E173